MTSNCGGIGFNLYNNGTCSSGIAAAMELRAIGFRAMPG